MTTTPANLRAVRVLLLDHLDIHDRSRDYAADLDPDEVGIPGDTDHAEGGDSYHLGADQIRARNGRDRYSVDESPRDRNGLTNYASALDIGWFEVRVAGKVHNLRTFSLWLVAQCKAGTVDTRDIREVIYSPDGKTVKRWDRVGRRTSGDSSHTLHTHNSYFRDAIKAGRDQTAVFRRYLTEIGLLAGEEPDVDAKQAQQLRDTHYVTAVAIPSPLKEGERVPLHVWCGWMSGAVKALATAVGNVDEATKAQLNTDLANLRADVQAIPGEVINELPGVDSNEEIAARLRALLGDKAAAVGQILAAG
jgi:hypothetical protein